MPEPEPVPEPEPEPEPEPTPTCIEGETRPAEDGCNDCYCNDGAWSCTEIACNLQIDDLSNDSDLESEESLGSIHYLSFIGFGVIVGIIALILLRSREST